MVSKYEAIVALERAHPDLHFRDCDGCDGGIVTRVMDDWSSDHGAGYKPIHGASYNPATREWLCPACSAIAR